MERTTWHFPKPLHDKKKLNKQEEQELFYRLAKDFSSILDREVIINNNYPIMFNDESTFIYYRASGFELNICSKKGWLFNKTETQYLKIAFFMVEPKNRGIGTKVIKHFIHELTSTTLEFVVLDTRDDGGRRFWRRIGFRPSYNLDEHLDWYLKLPK